MAFPGCYSQSVWNLGDQFFTESGRQWWRLGIVEYVYFWETLRITYGQETQDDINVATKTGEEFTCFVDEEYQYFRFKLIDSYDGQPRMCFAELEIYGEPHGYVAEEEADDTEQ